MPSHTSLVLSLCAKVYTPPIVKARACEDAISVFLGDYIGAKLKARGSHIETGCIMHLQMHVSQQLQKVRMSGLSCILHVGFDSKRHLG